MSVWWVKAAALVLPVCLGAGVARVMWPVAPLDAVGVLNTYALRVAFPALVCVGLLGGATLEGGVLQALVWVLTWPMLLAAMLVCVRLFARREHVGSLGLSVVFGNVAYVGLPVVALSEGEGALGVASWIVSIHVVLGVTVGAWWAAIHGGEEASQGVSLRGVWRQPLFWAPWCGGMLGWLGSESVVEVTRQVLSPLAQSAPPVALFMLGVYLYAQRHLLWRLPDRALAGHILACLCGVPCVLALACGALHEAGLMSTQVLRVYVLLGAMPVGITTFSIAYDAQCSPEGVAQAIVWSTVCSVCSVPCVLALMTWWGW